MNDPYNEGYEAYWADEPANRNPHDEEDLDFDDWDSGWLDAEDENYDEIRAALDWEEYEED